MTFAKAAGQDRREKTFLCAKENEKAVDFYTSSEPVKDTVELAVMGVRKEFYRKRIGKELFACAKKRAREAGHSFIQVKTVQMGKYENYDDTDRLYLSLGFKELEALPTLWGEWNPCQIYVMAV